MLYFLRGSCYCKIWEARGIKAFLFKRDLETENRTEWNWNATSLKENYIVIISKIQSIKKLTVHNHIKWDRLDVYKNL